MPSRVKAGPEKIKKKIFLAVLVALAVAINTLENAVPNPFPWIKLGLSNGVTLLVLILYGYREALMVTVSRVFLASLFYGGLFGPAFILSISGSLASVTAMGVMLATGLFSTVGLSVGGSFIHTLTQFVLLLILVVGDSSILNLAPPFLLLSLPAGALVGFIVMKSGRIITRYGLP